MKKYILFFLLLQFFAKGQTNEIRYDDKLRIKEALRISLLYGEKVWDGWNESPFAILLVYDKTEFLFNHPDPSDDFTLLENDSLLDSKVYYRKRVFDTGLLATFPAVNGLSTIVIGTPENTGKTSVDWIITILHEHFHQYQYSKPDYYSSVSELDLSGGDQTGMWMLNYPFPYENEKVNAAYDSCKKFLAGIFRKNDHEKDISTKFFLKRNELKDLLNEKDYTYMSFQLWQEGIARYTEIKLLQLMLEDNYEFSDEINNLKDYEPLEKHYNNYYTSILNLLNGLSLRDSKRNCFYAFGAFEGLFLDIINPGWKKKYFSEKFHLENYYPD